MITILGYTAYFLISVFSWLQLGFSLRKKTLNLGLLPLVALTLGLALLQVTLFYGVVPTYIIVGNAASTIGTALILLHTLSVQRAARRQAIIEKGRAGRSPNLVDMAQNQMRAIPPAGNRIQIDTLDFSSRSPYAFMTRDDFRLCAECSCLVFNLPENAVKIVAYDVFAKLARPDAPEETDFEKMLLPMRDDFYCREDKPAYDREVIVLGAGPVCSDRLFYKRMMTDAEHARLWRISGNVAAGQNPIWMQVRENGEAYD
jgi:hypothetical protein